MVKAGKRSIALSWRTGFATLAVCSLMLSGCETADILYDMGINFLPRAADQVSARTYASHDNIVKIGSVQIGRFDKSAPFVLQSVTINSSNFVLSVLAKEDVSIISDAYVLAHEEGDEPNSYVLIQGNICWPDLVYSNVICHKPLHRVHAKSGETVTLTYTGTTRYPITNDKTIMFKASVPIQWLREKDPVTLNDDGSIGEMRPVNQAAIQTTLVPMKLSFHKANS